MELFLVIFCAVWLAIFLSKLGPVETEYFVQSRKPYVAKKDYFTRLRETQNAEIALVAKK
jgi:hypothetical protein